MARTAQPTRGETFLRLFKLANKGAPVVADVTVGATEVLLEAGSGSTTRVDRGCLIVFNFSTAIIYLGPTGVTTASGIPLLPNDVFYWESEDDLYAIAAGAGNNVRVMETV